MTILIDFHQDATRYYIKSVSKAFLPFPFGLSQEAPEVDLKIYERNTESINFGFFVEGDVGPQREFVINFQRFEHHNP